MFLHKVRENIQKYLTPMEQLLKKDPSIFGENDAYVELHQNFMRWSKDAQCFHVGDSEFFFDQFDQSKQKPFEDMSYIKMPYDTTWFDWYRPAQTKGVSREGVLCMTHKDNANIYLYPVIELEPNQWLLTPIFLQIEKATGQVAKLYTSRGITPDQVESLERHFFGALMILLDSFLKFLSARNVRRVKKNPSQKLQKKRLKNNRLPLYSYWVLKLPHRGEIVSQPSTGIGSPKRIHWCRGHFKQRQTGIFWWSAHLRGRGKGIIDKDYEA